MKIIIFILLISMKALASNTLIDCAPKDGQMSPDQKLYTTYSLETNELSSPILQFRKGFLGEQDHSYLEIETYKLGFFFKQEESVFALAYQAGEDKMLILGMIWPGAEGDEVMATAVIMLDFAGTFEPIRQLVLPPENIKEWQCRVNIKDIKTLTAEKELKPKEKIKLEEHFKLPLRVTAEGN
ncbi:MAG: hypothetical protein H6625_13310 [Bdellovibrionaceae bacterium]|nr:hypothetical protein [Pseudobdellovibrionaceae bacterium]